MSPSAKEIKEAVEEFYKASDGDSSDDEHDAALNMADLLTEIAKSSDPNIVIRDSFEDDALEPHEDGYTYAVQISASAGMTLGPAAWRKDPEAALKSLWENVQDWFQATGPDPSMFIQEVTVIGGEHFTGGPDNTSVGGACDVYETLGLDADEDAVVYRSSELAEYSGQE